MTTANKITILRILLVPYFIFELLAYRESGLDWNRKMALAAFALAAILDGVDGFVARRFHQKSELGAVLDPLADKLLLASGIVLLSLDYPQLARIPLWLTITILSRDGLVLIGLLVVHLTCGSVRIRPRWTGKAATVLQMVVVLWVMLRWPESAMQWMALGVTVLTAISGAQYVLDGVRQLSESPRSAATPGQ